ncbi:hypothetical protein D3C72_426820 [compost metagenome]
MTRAPGSSALFSASCSTEIAVASDAASSVFICSACKLPSAKATWLEASKCCRYSRVAWALRETSVPRARAFHHVLSSGGRGLCAIRSSH